MPPSLAAFYVHRAHEKGDGLDWEHLNEIFNQVHRRYPRCVRL